VSGLFIPFVVLCGPVFLDAKKKSCGSVLSLSNFEVKKKERIFRHLLYSNEVSRLHPETTRQISIRNCVTDKKRDDLMVFLLLLLGFFFSFLFKQWGEVVLRFSFEDKLLFFPQLK
jgi:hypothetical protein